MKHFCENKTESDIRRREETLTGLLSKENIANLGKDNIIDIVHYSWATKSMWSDYPEKSLEIVKKNGLPRLRSALRELLYAPTSLDQRFDNFTKNVKGLGGQYISEILAFISPQDCCIWNRLAADVSIYMGMNNLLPNEVWRYHMALDGKSYLKCCEVLKKVKSELADFCFEKPDFLDVHNFVLFIYANLEKQQDVLKEIKSFAQEI